MNPRFGDHAKRIRLVKNRRHTLDRATDRTRGQIGQPPDAMIDRGVGFQITELKILDPAFVESNFTVGHQVGVKLARLRIDLRNQIGDVEIGRREIEKQLRFFAKAPAAAGACRKSDERGVNILKVDTAFVYFDPAVKFAQRLQQRMDHKLHVKQIQSTREPASALVAKRPGVADCAAYEAGILQAAAFEQRAGQHARSHATRFNP